MKKAPKGPIKDGREFPSCPRVGVGGVVIDHGRVLLVRRGQPPLQGEWSIPGGLVEVGESLKGAVEREIREETDLRVRAVNVLGVFERVIRTTKPPQEGKVRYHYVLIDFLCRLRRPARPSCRRDDPRALTDVTDARWVGESELDAVRISAAARNVIRQALHSGD
ncbi:MAG TPA: NUDIX hydrolase [Terriglobia bacterium]|nr:NUDIX hydrolase [Terriglobia bacterium]